MRRLFFHMGAHKTATTLVQIRLRERRVALEHAGICFVEPRRILGSAVEEYVSGRGQDIRKAIADFDDMVHQPTGCRRAIAVFEDILGKIDLVTPYSAASERIGRLMAVLAGSAGSWKLEPMFVVRRYDSFWLSSYRHNVKNGQIAEFDRALSSLEKFELDWRRVIGSIEAAVGHEIPVRRYEDLAELAEGEVVGAVLRAAGILAPAALKPPLGRQIVRLLLGVGDIAQRAISGHPNVSLSDRGLILAEAIRPLVTQEEWRRLFRPLLAKNFNRMLEPEATHFDVPSTLRQEMERRYLRDREWFGRRLELAYPTL